MTQSQALKIMLSGSNIFLTGSPGSGKTYLLNEYVIKAKKQGLRVAITATTGIAATHVNGMTIHSWSGIGIKDKLENKDMESLMKNQKLKFRYKNTNVLVIDEVSMLDSGRLDLINSLAKSYRSNDKPFGGMQLILVGDLFQLPPTKGDYVFKSQSWLDLKLKICYLTEQHRQYDGDELNHILKAIRANRITETELDVLTSKLSSTEKINRQTLCLYSHNFDADNLNELNLAKIKSKEKLYKMRTKGSTKAVETLKQAILSPQALKLKVGCEVIFTSNNHKAGYVNGDRGRVVGFKSNLPVVRMNRSAYLLVSDYRWQTEADGQVVAQVWQLPLKLAWAITIHKSQGMSLEEAVIDLGKTFSSGMGYVALSRLRGIDGLHLVGLNKMALYVDHNILKLDKILRAESDKLVLR